MMINGHIEFKVAKSNCNELLILDAKYYDIIGSFQNND